MKTIIPILLLSFLCFSCKKTYEVIIPDSTSWGLFNSPATKQLTQTSRVAMEGVYGLTSGTDAFGNMVAIKWTYVINNGDTTFNVSGFFGKDIAYFICEGKQLNDSILLNGYWRKLANTQTGMMRLTIAPADGAADLLRPDPVINPGGIIIKGMFGNGQETPFLPIAFTYNRTLYNGRPFQIMAHRAGGRNSNLLQASENSVAMILKSSGLGSTGIEVDVRLTKDGIPILYHDNTLNPRELQKCGLVGPIENYTYEQLSAAVRLIYGEKIPTLKEALTAVVYQTPLTYVWLDINYDGSLAIIQDIQQEFLQKAAAEQRKLDILIGLPGDEQMNEFISLPGYANIPSLCELSFEDVEKINALVWAPRFTEGTQNEQVARIHATGRKAFAWTVDVPDIISRYINDGNFDGMLSNFPSCIAYNYYVQQ